MKVRILSAMEKVFEGEALEVILPADGGQISVLDFHEPCLCRLRKGLIRVRFAARDKEALKLGVIFGMAKILPREIAILLET